MNLYHKTEYTNLIYADAFQYMAKLPNNCIDVLITDPPYFLSNGGISNSGGKIVSVDKGDWDKNQDPEQFYRELIIAAQRLLKKDGTIWIFGSMHNIYLVGYLLEKYNFKILNNITWQKTNPAPNLSHRMFTHSTETIIWARKSQSSHQIYNYELMKNRNNGHQMKDVWQTSNTGKCEKRFGKHPTQKPISVMKRIIEATTNEDSIILDPFVGSGTTIIASELLQRHSIGIDNNEEYLAIAKKRLCNLTTEKIGLIK